MTNFNRSVLIGASIGALSGGSLGYLLTDKKKGRKRRIKNAVYAALGGTAVGALGGSIYDSHRYYVNISNEANRIRKIKDAEKLKQGITPEKVSGTIYYANFYNHTFTPEGTNINLPIQHSGLVVIPDNGGTGAFFSFGDYDTQVNSSNYPNGHPPINFDCFKLGPTKGLKESDIGNYVFNGINKLADKGKGQGTTSLDWGDSIRLYGTHVEDIDRAVDFAEAYSNRRDIDGYNVLFNNCGNFARRLFDYTRNSTFGHILDLCMWGRPGMNAPSWGTRSLDFKKQ